MLRLLSVLMLFLIAGVGNVWGGKYTINYGDSFSPALPTASGSVNSTSTAHTVSGLAIKEQGIYKGSSNNYLMFVSGKGFLYNTSNLVTVTSVAATYSSGTSTSGKTGVYFGTSEKSTYTTSSNATIKGQSKTDTWTNSTAGNGYFQLSTSNKNVQITQIVITCWTKVTLDKNAGTDDGVIYFDDNATAASTATGYTFSAATHAGHTCTGYYTASSGGTKVLNANGTFANANVSGYVTGSKWIYAGGTLKLYAQWEADAAPTYTITAASNNNSYGTVALAGSVITAMPNEGYRIISGDDGYTVISGNATVERGTGANVNKFTVTPTSDCSVRINFEVIPTHKISFNTGGLTTIGDATGIQEGAVYNITQTPAASLTENCEYGTFVGWTTASSIADASVKPALVSSVTMSTSDVTLYAVYSKTTSGGGNSGSVTITHNSTNFPTGYAAAADYELEGYTFNIKQIYKNGKMQWRSSTNSAGAGVMYNKDVFPAKITSVVVTYNNDDAGNNHTLKVGSSANPSSGTAITPTSDDLVYTFDCSAANADYFVLTNGEGMGSTSSVVINYGSSGTTTYNLAANCCDPLGSINGSILRYHFLDHFGPFWTSQQISVYFS